MGFFVGVFGSDVVQGFGKLSFDLMVVVGLVQQASNDVPGFVLLSMLCQPPGGLGDPYTQYQDDERK